MVYRLSTIDHLPALKPIRIAHLYRPLGFQWRKTVVNLDPVPCVDEVEIGAGLNDPAESVEEAKQIAYRIIL